MIHLYKNIEIFYYGCTIGFASSMNILTRCDMFEPWLN